MRNRERVYHTYRVMVALNGQIGMFEDEYNEMKPKEVRHSIFKKVYNDIISKKMVKIFYKSKEYFLFATKELSEGTLLCKLSKEEALKIYTFSNKQFSDLDIEEEIVNNHPFVYIIIHLENQAFLVERNTTIYRDTDQCSRIMEQMFFDLMTQYNATMSVYPVTLPGSFWESYKSMERVTKLTLTINSPNLFEANDRAEEIARDFKDETNAQKTEIVFENKDNGLSIREYADNNKGVGKFLPYIHNGGGKWSLNGKKNGKENKIHSGNNKTTILLPQNVESGDELLDTIEGAVEIRGRGNEE